ARSRARPAARACRHRAATRLRARDLVVVGRRDLVASGARRPALCRGGRSGGPEAPAAQRGARLGGCVEGTAGDGDAVHQTPLAVIVIGGIVPGGAVVPEGNRALTPTEAASEFRPRGVPV